MEDKGHSQRVGKCIALNHDYAATKENPFCLLLNQGPHQLFERHSASQQKDYRLITMY